MKVSKELHGAEGRKRSGQRVAEGKSLKKIYEGKAKILYEHPGDKNKLITYFKDDATAFNGQKKRDNYE